MDEHRLLLRPPVWLPIVVALVAGGAYIVGKNIEARGYNPVLVTVDGRGEVTASPDIGELNFGVQTERHSSAEEAMEELSTKMNAIVAAVKAQGIADKDVITQNLSLYPSYDWDEGERINQGFEANQSLRVKVRDMDNIGTVLSAATSAGANQAGGVSFTIDDPEDLQAEARTKAIENAEEKAEVLAAQLGKRLGEIRNYSEGSSGGMPPMPYMARDAMAVEESVAQNAVPVPTGEQEVTVNVNITYELK